MIKMSYDSKKSIKFLLIIHIVVKQAQFVHKGPQLLDHERKHSDDTQ